MKQQQTDNSHLQAKLTLRLNHLPDKKELKVLDCFHGDGVLWREIQKKTGKKISVIGLDEKPKGGLTLKVKNEKFLWGLNLEPYDIIDLDAYGVPFTQLEAVLQRPMKKRFFLTFCQAFGPTGGGKLPGGFLEVFGFPKTMVKKCPSLFNRNVLEKMRHYLALKGVKNWNYISFGRQNYASFEW